MSLQGAGPWISSSFLSSDPLGGRVALGDQLPYSLGSTPCKAFPTKTGSRVEEAQCAQGGNNWQWERDSWVGLLWFWGLDREEAKARGIELLHQLLYKALQLLEAWVTWMLLKKCSWTQVIYEGVWIPARSMKEKGWKVVWKEKNGYLQQLLTREHGLLRDLDSPRHNEAQKHLPPGVAETSKRSPEFLAFHRNNPLVLLSPKELPKYNGKQLHAKEQRSIKYQIVFLTCSRMQGWNSVSCHRWIVTSY